MTATNKRQVISTVTDPAQALEVAWTRPFPGESHSLLYKVPGLAEGYKIKSKKEKEVQSECGESRGESLQQSKEGVRLGMEMRKVPQAWMVVGMGNTEASRTREVITNYREEHARGSGREGAAEGDGQTKAQRKNWRPGNASSKRRCKVGFPLQNYPEIN